MASFRGTSYCRFLTRNIHQSTTKYNLLNTVRKWMPSTAKDTISEASSEESQIDASTLPLENVSNRLCRAISEISQINNMSTESALWEDRTPSSTHLKFKIIRACHQEFGLLPPNQMIDKLKTMDDLVDYYQGLKPKNFDPFQAVDRNALPHNLSFGVSATPLPYFKQTKKYKKTVDRFSNAPAQRDR